MLMTHEQFCGLAKDIQARFTQHKGIFLAARQTKFASVKLYQLEDFYVELYHDKRLACISIVNSFSSTDRLQPYLEQIDVSALQDCWNK